jgi:hypothetical protein
MTELTRMCALAQQRSHADRHRQRGRLGAGVAAEHRVVLQGRAREDVGDGAVVAHDHAPERTEHVQDAEQVDVQFFVQVGGRRVVQQRDAVVGDAGVVDQQRDVGRLLRGGLGLLRAGDTSSASGTTRGSCATSGSSSAGCRAPA